MTTPHSISFRATSKDDVTATPVLQASSFRRAPQSAPLADVLKKSAVVQKPFGQPAQEDPDAFFGSRRRAPGPASADFVIIQSSGAVRDVVASPSGLVHAIMSAYNTHHNLVLRPDDVWQAILTQFSFYVNKNAEALRDAFVDFQGQKTLVVEARGTLFTADFGEFATRMVDEQIAKNIKEPEVAAWLIPAFSTTTPADRIAASVSVMSTMQAYFKFVCCLCCGIPTVTLEGTPDDWRLLRGKIDALKKYDLQDGLMTQWHALLAPVLEEFLRSAEGAPDLRFWDRVCSHHAGSGSSYLSGWVTVFACFTEEGRWQGDQVPGGARAGRSVSEAGRDAPPSASSKAHGAGEGSTDVTALRWPMIDTDQLPMGAVSVPVLVDDNGIQYDTHMFAGQFAFDVCGEGEAQDTIRPRNDWCIAYSGKPKAAPEPYRVGEIRPSPTALQRAISTAEGMGWA